MHGLFAARYIAQASATKQPRWIEMQSMCSSSGFEDKNTDTGDVIQMEPIGDVVPLPTAQVLKDLAGENFNAARISLALDYLLKLYKENFEQYTNKFADNPESMVDLLESYTADDVVVHEKSMSEPSRSMICK